MPDLYDTRLTDPPPADLRDTVAAARAAVNGRRRAGVVELTDRMITLLVKRVGREREGVHVPLATPGSTDVGRLVTAWRTDPAGRTDVRVRGWRTPDFNVDGPSGLTVDREGRLLVADTHFYRVLVYGKTGDLLFQIGVGLFVAFEVLVPGRRVPDLGVSADTCDDQLLLEACVLTQVRGDRDAVPGANSQRAPLRRPTPRPRNPCRGRPSPSST